MESVWTRLPPLHICVSDIQAHSQVSWLGKAWSAASRRSSRSNGFATLAPTERVTGNWIRLVFAGTEYLDHLEEVNQAVFWGWQKQPAPSQELIKRAQGLWALVDENVDLTFCVELPEGPRRIRVRRSGYYVSDDEFADNVADWMDHGFYKSGYHCTLKITSLDNGAIAELPVRHERQPLRSYPVCLEGRQSVGVQFRMSQGKYEFRLSAELLSDMTGVEEAFLGISVVDVNGVQTQIVEKQSESMIDRRVSFVVGNDCRIAPGKVTVCVDADIPHGQWQIRDFRYTGRERIFERITRKWTWRKTWWVARALAAVVTLLGGLGAIFDWIDWPFGDESTTESDDD